jgi:hypothetical protein
MVGGDNQKLAKPQVAWQRHRLGGPTPSGCLRGCAAPPRPGGQRLVRPVGGFFQRER